jgi:hypothetical protein
MSFIFQNKKYLFLNNISCMFGRAQYFLGHEFIQPVLFVFLFLLSFIYLNKQVQ